LSYLFSLKKNSQVAQILILINYLLIKNNICTIIMQTIEQAFDELGLGNEKIITKQFEPDGSPT